MKYISTRGKLAGASFSEILLEGLAPDGGLIIPETVPALSQAQIEAWRDLSYPELAAEIVGLYATDIPKDDLLELCQAAYNSEIFGDQNIVPLVPVHDHLTLVGLSEGPTLAFKDMAMQLLGQLIPYVLKKTDRTLNVIGATSGDTGSAAEHAFRAKEGIRVFMLSPQGRMSDFQRAQMYTLTDPNIHNLAVDGVFDDCQNIVKEISSDAAFKLENSIGTVNSINLGRVCAQIVYYFWTWLRSSDNLSVGERANHRITVAVPSGNFGNIYSGHLARTMGLGIERLILATNENNVLDEFFRTGIYEPRTAEDTLATSSPSMDISKASNLERFVYELFDNPEDFLRLWLKIDDAGKLELPEAQQRFASEFGFTSGSSTHQDRLDTIRAIYEQYDILVDPHTADGIAVAQKLSPESQVFVLETAKPAKFAETITEALGNSAPELTEQYLELLQKPQHEITIDNDSQAVRDYIADHVDIR